MKIVDNYRIFKKIIRKFNNRHCVKHVDYFNGRRFVSYWEKEDWLGYRVDSLDKLTPQVMKYIRFMIGEEMMEAFDVAENIKEKPNYLVHEEAGELDLGDMEYRFDGIMLTNRDAYAILKIDDYKYKKYDYLYPIFRLLGKKV